MAQSFVYIIMYSNDCAIFSCKKACLPHAKDRKFQFVSVVTKAHAYCQEPSRQLARAFTPTDKSILGKTFDGTSNNTSGDTSDDTL